MQGVVFNSHWLSYFDDAISQYFAALGYPPKVTFANELDFMVVKATLEWKGPATFDDRIDIAVRPRRLGRSSFDIAYEATIDGATVCAAWITYVLIAPGRNRSMEIPEELRAKLEAAMEE